jgi:hypothetical protein
MNTQERSILENFLNQLAQVRGVNKDPEAERLIQQALERQPDALYLLVQRTLLLSQALEQAKARIAELEQAQVESSRGFQDPGASGWPNPDAQRSYSAPAFNRPVAPPPQYPAAGPGAPVYAPYGATPGAPPVGGGMSGFLGQAAATAAGVAGGAFLFEGIEHLLGGHQGTPFMQSGPGAFPTEEVTVNNYYYPEETRHDEGEPSTPDNFGENRFADNDTPDDISIDDIGDPGVDGYADDNPANDEDFV